MEEKKGRKKLSVPGRGIEHTTLTLKGKGSSLYSNIYTAQNPWLLSLYEYHEGYILISSTISKMHMKGGERESVIELNLKVRRLFNVAGYEQL